MERALYMARIIYTQICIFLAIICFSGTAFSQENEWVHMAKASSLLKEGNVKGAITEYEKAIEENPGFVDAYNSLGYLYQHELKNSMKAIEVYSIGLKYDPNDYSLNLNIMYAYFDVGKPIKALEYYEHLSKIRSEDQTYSFPRETLDILLQDMTREETIAFCEKYLDMNPTDTMLREVLVDVYKKEKDFENAVRHLLTMLRYSREKSTVYFDLGSCNYNLGRYNKALEYFSKARQLGAYVPQQFFNRLEAETNK
jgi:tetratricopeptide (TPR) repeat protein